MSRKIILMSSLLVLGILIVGMVSYSAEAQSSSGIFRKIFELLVKHNNDMNLGLNTIIDDLQFKKRFYQFVDTDIEVTGNGGDDLSAKVERVACDQELEDAHACAFNVESILVEADIDPGESATITAIVVDGVPSVPPVITLTAADPKANYILDSVVSVVGASDSVEILIDVTGTITFTKIEFNGEQPQGLKLELQVTTI